MKRPFALWLLASVALVAVSVMIVSRQQAARYAAQLAREQARWQAEKAVLEAALEAAQARHAVPATLRAPPSRPVAPTRLSPEEILAKLEALRLGPDGNSATVLRQAVYWLEELAQSGPPAFPAIREFLGRYQEVELDTSWFQSRGARDRLPLDFTLPPSLRFGLFDVLRRVGGAEAATILSESLARTGRGVEVAYLARVLQEMAPEEYRDLSLSVARALLADPAPLSGSSPLDRNHRDHLFGVLAFFGDASFAGEAQTQLVRADGLIDRGALKYLQQALGAQAVPIAAAAYDQPALASPAAKEPLARLALSFVGADTQADQFYQRTINDPALTGSDRSNLIEDLNEDGFADTKNLTTRDLPLIQNRIALIEQLAPEAIDEVNAAAFKEAYKDLVAMRERVLSPPPPPQPSSAPGQPQP